MRKLFVFALIIFAASSMALAQGNPEPRKSVEQIMRDWREHDNQKAIAEVASNHKKVEEELAKFNKLVGERDQLIEKLKRALADGDATLIEVALSDLRSNRDNLAASAKWVVGEHGDSLLRAARNAYRTELITEDRYTSELKFFRAAKARTEEQVPEALTNLLSEARKKVPDYFGRLQAIGRPYDK